MAEALGVTAAAIAVAELGFKLTKNIAGYLNDASTARQQLEGITSNINITAQTIEEVGSVFNNEEVIASAKPSAVAAAMDAIQRCKKLFEEIGEEIEKAQKYNGLSFPFRAGNFKRLNDGLESYKSTLMLLMLILQHSKEMRTDHELRTQAKEYLRLKSEAEERMREAAQEDAAEQKEVTEHNVKAEQGDEAGLAGDVSGENCSIPFTYQEPHKSQGETEAVSNEIDTRSAEVDGEPSVSRELLQTFNNTILPTTIPATPDPDNNPFIQAAMKSETPTDRDAAAQSSQCVTEAQLADCVENLKDMIDKIELLQNVLPTTSSISKCLEDNRIPQTASEVKKKLGAIVDSCKQQEQSESLTENAKMDHHRPIGISKGLKKYLKRINAVFERTVRSHEKEKCPEVPAIGKYVKRLRTVLKRGNSNEERVSVRPIHEISGAGRVYELSGAGRVHQLSGAGRVHELPESAVQELPAFGAFPRRYPIEYGEADVLWEDSTGGEVDALLKEWTTVYDD